MTFRTACGLVLILAASSTSAFAGGGNRQDPGLGSSYWLARCQASSTQVTVADPKLKAFAKGLTLQADQDLTEASASTPVRPIGDLMMSLLPVSDLTTDGLMDFSIQIYGVILEDEQNSPDSFDIRLFRTLVAQKAAMESTSRESPMVVSVVKNAGEDRATLTITASAAPGARTVLKATMDCDRL